MESTRAIDRTLIVDVMCEAVHEQLLEGAEPGQMLPAVEEDTVLFGQDGLLDSLGLVSAIMEIEERVRSASVFRSSSPDSTCSSRRTRRSCASVCAPSAASGWPPTRNRAESRS